MQAANMNLGYSNGVPSLARRTSTGSTRASLGQMVEWHSLGLPTVPLLTSTPKFDNLPLADTPQAASTSNRACTSVVQVSSCLEMLHLLTESVFSTEYILDCRTVCPTNVMLAPQSLRALQDLPADCTNECSNGFYYTKWTVAYQHNLIVCTQQLLSASKLELLRRLVMMHSEHTVSQHHVRELQIDLSSLRQDHQRLMEMESTLSSVLYHAPMLAYSKRADGRYIMTNKMFDDQFGMPDKPMPERTDWDYFPDNVAETFHQRDLSVLNSGKYEMEEEAVDKTGDRRTYLSIKFPINDAVNTPFAVAGIAFDITQRKLDEAARVQINSEMEAARKVEHYRRNLLMTFSHELRTPLNAIQLACECADASLSPTQADSVASTVKQQALLLDQMIDDMMHFEKIQTNQPIPLAVTTFQLKQLQQTVLATWQGRLRSREAAVELQMFTLPADAVVTMDYLHLLQMINHLVSNSVKHTAAGTIKVAVEVRHQLLALSVADTGEGMQSETLQRVLQATSCHDKEFLSANQMGGLGFGLFLTQYFCRLMDGAFDIQSTCTGLQSGTTVTMQLPCSTSVQTASPDQCRRVLVIDDVAVNLKLLARCLQKEGFIATCASSGKEAVTICQTCKYDFCAVLIDWQMPEMDGIQTMHALKSIGIKCNMVLVSANILPGDSARLYELGFDQVIAKPLTKDKLRTLRLRL